ncbi:MAG: alpha/beta fold hydrolase [Myxococcota bacterium]
MGAGILRLAAARLGGGELRDVVDPASPDDDWRARARAIAPALADRLVVAHGLAVPVAVEAARAVPPAALVLSNGPLGRVDPVTAALGRIPGLRALLAPPVWLRWLASSAGLRRAVANPYAMDRDTVAALCGPGVATPAARRATASFLASLPGDLPDGRDLACPVLLLWGDDDALYPAFVASALEAAHPRATYVAVPGGRFLHPEERPWAMADAIARWRSEGPSATSMS